MARMTRAQALTTPDGYDTHRLLAVLVSATNPDGTPYTLPVAPPAVASADVLTGRGVFVVTTAATTLITVPAGRSWSGTVGASVSCAVTAASATAGQATATFTTAGAGAVPAPGTHFAVDALVGANAATGTTGAGASNFGSAPLRVVAPAGNAVTIAVAATCSGSSARVDAFAVGSLDSL